MHKVLGIRNRAGLNEVLHGEVQELPLIVVSPTLSVLTAGPVPLDTAGRPGVGANGDASG